MLLFLKTLKNQEYSIKELLSDFSIVKQEQSLVFPTKTNLPTSTIASSSEQFEICSYPLRIETFFPLWLSKLKDQNYTDIYDSNSPTLVDLIKAYYGWIYCFTKPSVTPDFGFFELDKVKQTNKIFLQYFVSSYIPSLKYTVVNTDITEDQVINLIKSIRIKLYNKKGTESSFKYLISLFFDLDPADIWITYPKRYIMVLNGGKNSEISGATDLISRNIRKGLLNYSVLSDNNVWNDYSYILNVENIWDPEPSKEATQLYERTIKPILHPAGINGIYHKFQSIFNRINESIDQRLAEIPKIKNYLNYTFESTSSVVPCSSTDGKQYVFPNWDKQISKMPSTTTFGDIKFSDFMFLEPIDLNAENAFPNDAIENTVC